MIKKNLILVIFAITILLSCEVHVGYTYYYRINLKNGENHSNENGFGCFNENGSAALCKLKPVNNYSTDFIIVCRYPISRDPYTMSFIGKDYNSKGYSSEYEMDNINESSNIAAAINAQTITFKNKGNGPMVSSDGYEYSFPPANQTEAKFINNNYRMYDVDVKIFRTGKKYSITEIKPL